MAFLFQLPSVSRVGKRTSEQAIPAIQKSVNIREENEGEREWKDFSANLFFFVEKNIFFNTNFIFDWAVIVQSKKKE